MVAIQERPFLGHLSRGDSLFKRSHGHLVRARRAWALFEKGDYASSLTEYQSLLPSYPDSPDLMGLIGTTLFRLKRFDEAISVLKRASKLERSDPDILNMLGASLGSAGQVTDASRILAKAHDMRPDDSEITYNLALSLMLLGRHEDALVVIDDALRGTISAKDDLKQLRLEIVDAQLLQLAKRGQISWSGGKPKGPKTRVELSPGPPISEWIIESRR